ncbi:MAG: class I SAM-dependent methyltransferase [Verrucomicrobiales bacterium]
MADSSNGDISEIYLSGEYTDKNPTFHVEDSSWKAKQALKILQSHDLHPENICEIGCGAGEILNQLHRQLPDSCLFTGYELSPQGFALCQERTKPRLSFHNQNLFTTTPKPTFDLVLCMDVFEHVDNYFEFLRHLRQHSKHFIFHIPLDMNAQMVARAEPIQRVRQKVGHLHYFSKDTALAALTDTGFQIKSWFFTPNGIDRPRTTKAKLAKLPRKIFSAFSQELTARIFGGYSLLALASTTAHSSDEPQTSQTR